MVIYSYHAEKKRKEKKNLLHFSLLTVFSHALDHFELRV